MLLGPALPDFLLNAASSMAWWVKRSLRRTNAPRRFPPGGTRPCLFLRGSSPQRLFCIRTFAIAAIRAKRSGSASLSAPSPDSSKNRPWDGFALPKKLRQRFAVQFFPQPQSSAFWETLARPSDSILARFPNGKTLPASSQLSAAMGAWRSVNRWLSPSTRSSRPRPGNGT